MGQGQINQFTPGPAPIDGIVKALQGLQAYYGIDTAKAQAHMENLKAQAMEQEMPLKKAQVDAEMGYINKYNNQGQDQGRQPQSKQDLDNQIQDTGAGPQGTPLASAMNAAKKLNPDEFAMQELKAGNYVSPNEIARLSAKAKLGLEQTEYGQKAFDLAHSDQKFAEESTNRKLGAEKTSKEIGYMPTEQAAKATKAITDLQDKFNGSKPVTEAKSKISGYETAISAIKSGNPISQNIAQITIPLLGTDLKRYGEALEAAGHSRESIGRAQTFLSKGATGKLDAQAQAVLLDAAQLGRTSAYGDLDNLTNTAAKQGVSAGAFKDEASARKAYWPDQPFDSSTIQFGAYRGLPIEKADKQIRSYRAKGINIP